MTGLWFMVRLLHDQAFLSGVIEVLTGDVMHISALGQSIVVLGSEKAAIDLLDKRSASYSDRPNFPMHDLYVFVGIIKYYIVEAYLWTLNLSTLALVKELVGQTCSHSCIMENNSISIGSYPNSLLLGRVAFCSAKHRFSRATSFCTIC